MTRQDQPIIWRPSRGVFSSGSGGPSNEVLRMLEQEAAHSPGDANAEVWKVLQMSSPVCFRSLPRH